MAMTTKMSETESWSVLDVNKWLHQVAGKEAEALLKRMGITGSFLVRHGMSKPFSYTVTVRRGKDDFVHVKIYNNGDCYDVFDGSENNEFASLVELLFHYWTNAGQLSEKNGNIIELLHPLLNDTEEVNDKWFYGSITAKLAEKLLMTYVSHDNEGTFLVRKRMSDQHQFVISIHTGGRIEHIVVEYQGIEYSIASKEVRHRFHSLSQLVDFYKTHDIHLQDSRQIRLLWPLLLNTVDGTKQQKDKLLLEFNELQKLDTQNLQKPRHNGQKIENKERNRYKNILPFDETRVKLNNGDPTVVGSDYINANYISVPDCPIRYIATQGCLAATVADFWRMVWQEQSTIIVMVTELVEMGKNKCTQYWPKPDGKVLCHKAYNGHIFVQMIKELDHTDYKIREFLVRFEQYQAEECRSFDTERTIYQYHFTSWPDKALPKRPEVLVKFSNEVVNHQSQIMNAGPIIVHCSAGIGRTGTFIVVGFMLYQFKKASGTIVNIQEIVHQVRAQRAGMVQTEAQYRFLYDVVPFLRKLRGQVEYGNSSAAEENSNSASAVYENLKIAD